MRYALPAVVLIAVAGSLAAACGGGGEEASSPSPAATQSPQATATPRATATPAASPTPQEVRQPEWSVEQQPSGADVTVILSDGVNRYTVASVSAEFAQFERWSMAYDQDLDGDGVNEAIVSHYTGGAHCCSEYLVFRSGPAGIESLDSFSLGNAGINALKDLDGDGIPEMRSYDDRLAYFDGLPYAVSQFLPLVLCRSDQGVYVDCTPEFPEFLLAGADGFEQGLGDAVAGNALEEEKQSWALALLASYSRLGMDDEGWSKVDAACADCGDWLRLNLAELDERVSLAQPYREQ